MLWGQYPAPVQGPRGNYVDGMVCVVETEVYSVSGVRLEMDGQMVSGRMFVWADADLRALEEGTWWLEEWKREVEEEMASHFQPVED